MAGDKVLLAPLSQHDYVKSTLPPIKTIGIALIIHPCFEQIDYISESILGSCAHYIYYLLYNSSKLIRSKCLSELLGQ